MAIIYCDGWDYTASTDPELYTVGRTLAAGTSTSGTGGDAVGTGVRSYGPIGTSHYVQRNLPAPLQSGGMGFFMYPTTLTSGIVCDLIDPGATNGVHMSLYRDGYGMLYFVRQRATTVFYTPIHAREDRWVHIEIKWTIDDVVGSFELRANGNAETQQTFNGDTRAGGALGCWAVRLTGLGNTTFYDKWVVWDTTGTRNNDWLGITDVIPLKPDGVGGFNQWVPNTAVPNWQSVDEVVEDDNTTYNSTTVVTDKDRLTFEDLPSLNYDVLAVQVSGQANKVAGAGSYELAWVAYDGVTEATGTTLGNLSTAYLWFTDVFEDHPTSAAPWTAAEVNAGEFGYVRVT